ncbi:esterase/lipase family protein [Ralstonia solanacearum]|uniref:DUF7379 domain-containing protein n=1 Tax=Ralstonia solanacearum TaxID=305 RepID=A0AAE3NGZ8_RALSL|nr:hypothetical protein [Ralstonia solanacearum]MBB6583803.1 hypothetical protein [Ralstonia solanacearum]MDB0521765.1 hypothetical protein [Ralstonia solanacearum]
MANPVPLDLLKSKELSDALDLAQSNGEVVAQNIKLSAIQHPVTTEFGLTVETPTQGIDGANLLVLRHTDTGVIQFVFPVQGAQPVAQGDGLAHNFGFILPRQLATTVSDAEKWIGTALKIPQNLETDAIDAAARVIEAASKKEGFVALANGYASPPIDGQLSAANGKRVLLFIHGIFSSIEGAFKDLGDPSASTTMRSLVQAYQGNVFGYDHWTISKTPLQNALDLLRAIPAGANWDVDVVCHSRGGLITRSIFADLAPIDSVSADLKSIVAARNGKIRSVNKVIFVAAANQGSQLADPDSLRNFLNIAALLASRSPCFSLTLVIGLARLLVSSLFNLQSIQQLSTHSPLVSDLNTVHSIMSEPGIFGARADFDSAKSVLLQAGVLLDRLLMQVDNDLVVPYTGVASPKPDIPESRLLDFGTPGAKQGDVWHTEFFGQEKTHTFLNQHLVASSPNIQPGVR